jgi:hexosaminidase
MYLVMSLAAVVSYLNYPALGRSTYKVRSGETIMELVERSSPVRWLIIPSPLPMKNMNSWTRFDRSSGALFPFELHIHMGGDECPKNYWEKTPNSTTHYKGRAEKYGRGAELF